jgi:hypothetical protein
LNLVLTNFKVASHMAHSIGKYTFRPSAASFHMYYHFLSPLPLQCHTPLKYSAQGYLLTGKDGEEWVCQGLNNPQKRKLSVEVSHRPR